MTDDLRAAIGSTPLILVDTLRNDLCEIASVVLPSVTWAEKSGTFENVGGRLQSFSRAIKAIDYAKGEAQIACELIAARADRPSFTLTSEQVRERMAATPGLECFAETELPAEGTVHVESDMQLVDL